jgi:hypothetical protein
VLIHAYRDPPIPLIVSTFHPLLSKSSAVKRFL